MKIAILVYLFPPIWTGGTEIATFNVAKYLIRKNHEIHIVTTLDTGQNDYNIDNGMIIHRIPGKDVEYFGSIYFWINVIKILKSISPDIIHIQSAAMGIPIILLKKLIKKPILLWLRGSEIYLPWPLKSTKLRLIFKNVDSTIALTRDMKDKIQHLSQRQIQVIPNGVETDKFSSFSKIESRNDLKISDNELIILYVGSLRPIKGVEILIKAIYLLDKDIDGFKLLIIGNGPQEEYLKNLVIKYELIEKIKFIGRISNDIIHKYFLASDIFVLPSSSEGFPNVILEAMAAGLPIVASNVCGLSEILKQNENGLLVEPGVPEDLAKSILILLTNNELRSKMIINNRQLIKKYTWESVIDILAKEYEIIVADSKYPPSFIPK